MWLLRNNNLKLYLSFVLMLSGIIFISVSKPTHIFAENKPPVGPLSGTAIPLVSPPDPPPPMPDVPPPFQLYECVLHPVTEREYILLEAVTTHKSALLGERYFPPYLLDAINDANSRAGERKYGVENIFRFISYRDMTQLVLLLNRDAKNHNRGFFRRFFWPEEFSGIQYDNVGIPERDEMGGLSYRRTTNWMAERNADNTEDVNNGKPLAIKTVVDSVVEGLYNKDPRVRLQCLMVLKEMGPMDYVQEHIEQAVNLDEDNETLETVGNHDKSWYLGADPDLPGERIHEPYKWLLAMRKKYGQDPPASADLTEEEKELIKLFGTSFQDKMNGINRTHTRRYVFCDLDGRPHWAVPFIEFGLYNREIKRAIITRRMEIEQDLFPEDLSKVDVETFLTVTDNINLIGYHGVNKNTWYNLAPQKIGHIIYPGDKEYNGVESELANAEFAENVPKTSYVRKTSYIRPISWRILMSRFRPLKESEVNDVQVSEEDMRYLINLFFGALEHRNGQVRNRAAEVLYELYRAEILSHENQSLIRNYTLVNETLREVMKLEFIPYERTQNLHAFVNHAFADPRPYHDFDRYLVRNDKQYGDQFLRPYNTRPEIIRQHTPVDFERGDPRVALTREQVLKNILAEQEEPNRQFNMQIVQEPEDDETGTGTTVVDPVAEEETRPEIVSQRQIQARRDEEAAKVFQQLLGED